MINCRSMTCVLYTCNTEICSWASWVNKKSSSIPHKNPLTVLLAAPQGVTLSSIVAMVLATILLCASWGNQGILNEQLPNLHSAFWADLSPLIRQDFVHQFWRMDSISPRSQCTFKDY